MTNQQHPITPPTELVTKWTSLACEEEGWKSWDSIATQAAQWGWDQRGAANEAELRKARDEELGACIELLDINGCPGKWLDMLLARRPTPPSLKEQALLQLDTLNADLAMHGRGCDLSQIRRALEALPND